MIEMFDVFIDVEPEWVSHELGTSVAMFAKKFVKAGTWLITRTEYGGSKIVGKFWKPNHKIGFVDLNGRRREVNSGVVEVLKNPPAGVQVEWVKGVTGQSAPAGAIMSGETADGSPLYVVKSGNTPGYYDASNDCARVYPGKVDCETDFYYLRFSGGGES